LFKLVPLVVSFFPELFPSTFQSNIASIYQFPHIMIGSSLMNTFLHFSLNSFTFNQFSPFAHLAFQPSCFLLFLAIEFFSSFKLRRQLPNW